VVEDLIERRVQALSKSLKEAAPTGWRSNANTNANTGAGNSLAARMESRQQDIETVAVTSASNASNASNTQTNESHESGVPPTGLDHD
jgi:hypothetical protein